MAMHLVHSVQRVLPTWPKTTNTGVPDGTVLTDATSFSLGHPDNALGVTVENKRFNGNVFIEGPNVTLSNCLIRGFNFWGILDEYGLNCRIENCTIDGTGTHATSGIGIGGGNAAVIGCDIFGMVLAIQIFGQCRVADNYIHDLDDTDLAPESRHFDAITLFGSSNSVIDNNAMIMPADEGGTAAVFIAAKNANIDNIMVSNNLMMGQVSYMVYSEADSGGSGYGISGVTFTDNYIDKGQFGYANFIGNTPVYSFNTEWEHGVDPTPDAVQLWLDAT